MKEALTFDDVLIVPRFSEVRSRKDVDISSNQAAYPYMGLPVIAANMDSVTGPEMARTMMAFGGQACLHRFYSIEDNIRAFHESRIGGTGELEIPLVSIGLGDGELERAEALIDAGALMLVIDVAHGAQMAVVEQAKELRAKFRFNIGITVGNFASVRSIHDFLYNMPYIDGIKIGVGPGAACTTRVKTGVGYPQLSAIMEISQELKKEGLAIIADGGLKTPGDIAKALGAGAHMVMVGSILAGTDEAPGERVWRDTGGVYRDKNYVFPKKRDDNGLLVLNESRPEDILWPAFKTYRGSASKESYASQGKNDGYRTAEGESFYVPYKGPVKDVLQDIEGGLRSAFSYVGARNLEDFHDKVEFVRVTNAGIKENGAHGKV